MAVGQPFKSSTTVSVFKSITAATFGQSSVLAIAANQNQNTAAKAAPLTTTDTLTSNRRFAHPVKEPSAQAIRIENHQRSSCIDDTDRELQLKEICDICSC